MVQNICHVRLSCHNKSGGPGLSMLCEKQCAWNRVLGNTQTHNTLRLDGINTTSKVARWFTRTWYAHLCYQYTSVLPSLSALGKKRGAQNTSQRDNFFSEHRNCKKFSVKKGVPRKSVCSSCAILAVQVCVCVFMCALPCVTQIP